MQLETKRLILRKHRKSDWKDLVEGIGNYDVAKMLTTVPFPYTKKDADNYINKSIKRWKKKVIENYVFLIELKSEKKVIGSVGLHKVNLFHGVGTTGSWINKKYWGNGYVTEAKIAINDFAFNELKLRRIESGAFTNNIVSNAVQIKMGYKLEGTKRKNVKCMATGKIHDENIYGLMKEEWEKIRPSLIKKMKSK